MQLGTTNEQQTDNKFLVTLPTTFAMLLNFRDRFAKRTHHVILLLIKFINYFKLNVNNIVICYLIWLKRMVVAHNFTHYFICKYEICSTILRSDLNYYNLNSSFNEIIKTNNVEHYFLSKDCLNYETYCCFKGT
jgi:hypothetical protein